MAYDVRLTTRSSCEEGSVLPSNVCFLQGCSIAGKHDSSVANDALVLLHKGSTMQLTQHKILHAAIFPWHLHHGA